MRQVGCFFFISPKTDEAILFFFLNKITCEAFFDKKLTGRILMAFVLIIRFSQERVYKGSYGIVVNSNINTIKAEILLVLICEAMTRGKAEKGDLKVEFFI